MLNSVGLDEHQSSLPRYEIPFCSNLIMLPSTNLAVRRILFREALIMEVLSVVAIIVAGLMVGCELAIAAFIHPTLDKLPDDAHLSAASSIARVSGLWQSSRRCVRARNGCGPRPSFPARYSSGREPTHFAMTGHGRKRTDYHAQSRGIFAVDNINGELSAKAGFQRGSGSAPSTPWPHEYGCSRWDGQRKPIPPAAPAASCDIRQDG
jgi:hypothetical protein